jgi:hypothetical protein
MANIDSAFGLRPYCFLSGAPWSGQARKYAVAANYASAIFIGTPVDLVGTTDATGKFPRVQKATLADGNYTIGPVVSIEPDYDDLTKQYIKATPGKERYVYVADDPNIIFEIQADGTPAAADFGLNGIMVETASGSTITGLSGVEYDESSSTTDASNMLQLLRLVDRPNNTLADAANVLVLISAHRYLNELGGRLGA